MGFICYAANIAPTSKDGPRPSPVREAAEVLSFCALLFDALGALFALITSGTLILKASEAKGYTTAKQKLFDNIDKSLKLTFPEQHSPQSLYKQGREYHNKARRLAYSIDRHLRSYFDVILVIIA